jgi:indolepyruvate ferredoxin oxidoreductase
MLRRKDCCPYRSLPFEEAIRLNGTFVDGNLRTLALGRLAAHDPDALARELGKNPEPVALATIDHVLASRTRLLSAYQDTRYAERYRSYVDDVRTRVAALALTGGDLFVREVALTLARLMAYKDEYEVARLYTDPQFMDRMRAQFSGDFRMRFHLAPPFLTGRDASGRPKKRTFGAWMLNAFRMLAALRKLRGTALDVFGHTAERRMERRLIEDYRTLVSRVLEGLNATNLAAGIEVVRAAGEIAGYGPVKIASVAAYEAKLPKLIAEFDSAKAELPSAGQIEESRATVGK